MDKNLGRIERYLQSVDAPEHASHSHREQLRRRILTEVTRGHPASRQRRAWRIAAAAGILVSVAGLVAAVVEMKYRFAGRRPDSTYQFVGKDMQNAYTISTPDANGPMDVAQTATDLAEIDRLRQQRTFNVARVIEWEVDGCFDSRTLVHQYTLSNGRIEEMGEGDADDEKQTPLTSLPTAAWREIRELRHAGKGEVLGIQERQVKGRPFVFKRERYTLSDGRKVIMSVGEPKDAQPAPRVVPTENHPTGDKTP